jgi:hypothetical protein
VSKIVKQFYTNNFIFTPLEYNVKHFDGKKFVVLANSTPIGIANFFGFVLMGGAAYSLFLIVMIYILNKKNKDKLYTLDDLKWD